MLELLCSASREYGAIAKAKVRAIIQNGYVCLAKQSGDCTERAAKAAVEKHRVLASEKSRDAPFEFAMEIGHSREHRRTASAQSVCAECLVRRDQHLGMIGKAEIIIRAEINHRPRFAAIADHRAGVCAGEEFRFIQFDRPCTDA